MSAKAIREYDAKTILHYWLHFSSSLFPGDIIETTSFSPLRIAQILCDLPREHSPTTYTKHIQEVLDTAAKTYPWLLEPDLRLVVKPDQLIKRRAQRGLISLNCSWDEARQWILETAGKTASIGSLSAPLHVFICEPFIPHEPQNEYYICIRTERDNDVLLFTHEGGVTVGNVEEKAKKLQIPLEASDFPTYDTFNLFLTDVPLSIRPSLIKFLIRLYTVFVTCHFTYLEVNPLVVRLNIENKTESVSIDILDVAAKLDQTAEFEAGAKWACARSPKILGMQVLESEAVEVDAGPPMVWPTSFGRMMTREEQYIAELDSKTGASLKLTLLNPQGQIWTLIAGGGASVVFADAIAVAGYAKELANYGEYSGAPTETQTYEYTRTIFDLMTRVPLHPEGKFLFIGGSIANFTNVSTTFKGVIRAMREYASAFHAHRVQIWVRRAGPNYQEGLRAIKAAGEELGLPMQVFGPETHISDIVHFALGKKTVEPMTGTITTC